MLCTLYSPSLFKGRGRGMGPDLAYKIIGYRPRADAGAIFIQKQPRVTKMVALGYVLPIKKSLSLLEIDVVASDQDCIDDDRGCDRHHCDDKFNGLIG